MLYVLVSSLIFWEISFLIAFISPVYNHQNFSQLFLYNFSPLPSDCQPYWEFRFYFFYRVIHRGCFSSRYFSFLSESFLTLDSWFCCIFISRIIARSDLTRLKKSRSSFTGGSCLIRLWWKYDYRGVEISLVYYLHSFGCLRFFL